MINLVSDQTPATHSPKRKFSFRFPHLSNSADKSGSLGGGGASGSALTPTHGNASPFSKKKNFTEELQSIPDIQVRNRRFSSEPSTPLELDHRDPDDCDLTHDLISEFCLHSALSTPPHIIARFISPFVCVWHFVLVVFSFAPLHYQSV